MTSFKLNMGQKYSDFEQLHRQTSKLGNLKSSLAISNFQELFVNEFDRKLSQLKIKICFLK